MPNKLIKIRTWTLELSKTNIPNLTDFCREFLAQININYTGNKKDQDGVHKALFTDNSKGTNYMWYSAVQDGNILTLRLKEI